jgi:hypothetical protein
MMRILLLALMFSGCSMSMKHPECYPGNLSLDALAWPVTASETQVMITEKGGTLPFIIVAHTDGTRFYSFGWVAEKLVMIDLNAKANNIPGQWNDKYVKQIGKKLNVFREIPLQSCRWRQVYEEQT